MPFRERFRSVLGRSRSPSPSRADEPPIPALTRKSTLLTVPVTVAAATTSSKKDLWDEAYEKLKRDQPKVVKCYEEFLGQQQDNRGDAAWASLPSSPGRDREARLASLLAAQADAAQAARLRVTLGTYEVVLVDKVEKIVKAVLWAKDFIGQAASNEPHAALAWAGVSLLLPLLVNPSEQNVAALDGLDYIQSLVLRYRILEKVYLVQTDRARSRDVDDVRDELQSNTIKLFSQVLEFQIRLIARYDRSSASRYLRDVVKADDWAALLAGVQTTDLKGQQYCDALGSETWKSIESATYAQEKRLLSIDETQVQLIKMMEDNLQETIEVKQNQLDRSRSQMQQETYEILQILNPSIDCEKAMKRNELLEPGTGKWLFDHPAFKEFKAVRGPRMLLATAEPGSGKSVMMRSLVKDLLSQPQTYTTCYYFFKDEPGQKSHLDALLGLVHQLLKQESQFVSQIATKLVRERGQGIRRNASDLWKILTECAQSSGNEIICVLDALDECETTGRETLIGLLNDYFRDCPPTSRLKLIVSGRPYYNAKYKFRALTAGLPYPAQVSGEEAPIQDDMPLVLRGKVEKLDLDEETKIKLKQRLLERHFRTKSLLWLSIALEELKGNEALQKASDRTLDDLLHDLPNRVEDQYENMLESSDDKVRARFLLSVVIASRSALTLAQLKVADAIIRRPTLESYDDLDLQDDDTFKRVMRGVCGLFLTFIDGNVYLFHQTAKDYLLADPTQKTAEHHGDPMRSQWRHSFDVYSCNTVLTQVCFRTMEIALSKVESALPWNWRGTKAKSSYDAQTPPVMSKHDFFDAGDPWPTQYDEWFVSVTTNRPLLAYACRNYRLHAALSLTKMRHWIKPEAQVFVQSPELLDTHSPLLDVSTEAFWSWLLIEMHELVEAGAAEDRTSSWTRLRRRGINYLHDVFTRVVETDRDLLQRYARLKVLMSRDLPSRARNQLVSRFHRDQLSLTTLLYYNIPFEFDLMDRSYVILVQTLSKSEIDTLFAHESSAKSPGAQADVRRIRPRVSREDLSHETLKYYALPFWYDAEDARLFILPRCREHSDFPELYRHGRALSDGEISYSTRRDSVELPGFERLTFQARHGYQHMHRFCGGLMTKAAAKELRGNDTDTDQAATRRVRPVAPRADWLDDAYEQILHLLDSQQLKALVDCLPYGVSVARQHKISEHLGHFVEKLGYDWKHRRNQSVKLTKLESETFAKHYQSRLRGFGLSDHEINVFIGREHAKRLRPQARLRMPKATWTQGPQPTFHYSVVSPAAFRRYNIQYRMQGDMISPVHPNLKREIWDKLLDYSRRLWTLIWLRDGVLNSEWKTSQDWTQKQFAQWIRDSASIHDDALTAHDLDDIHGLLLQEIRRNWIAKSHTNRRTSLRHSSIPSQTQPGMTPELDSQIPDHPDMYRTTWPKASSEDGDEQEQLSVEAGNLRNGRRDSVSPDHAHESTGLDLVGASEDMDFAKQDDNLPPLKHSVSWDTLPHQFRSEDGLHVRSTNRWLDVQGRECSFGTDEKERTFMIMPSRRRKSV